MNPIVTIKMKNGDVMKIELYPGNGAQHRGVLCKLRAGRLFTTAWASIASFPAL